MFKRICIGNDHGGVDAKNLVVGYLKENGYEVDDRGTGTEDIVRYPYYAAQVCSAVQQGRADAGILICSTGIGMSVAANKFKGIRAALCTSHYTAMMTRRHNDSNVLCLGGKTSGPAEILDILEAWLANSYEGGRHDISLKMIALGEAEVFARPGWEPPRDIDPKDL